MLVEKLEKISLNRKLFKKLLCTVLALATAFTSLPLMLTEASAYDYAVSDDGFYYENTSYYYWDTDKEVEGVSVCGYQNKNAEKIVIPEKINGQPVIKIAYEAFESYEALKSVTVPKSVIEIEGYCFSKCKNLTDVIFSEGIENIWYNYRRNYESHSCTCCTNI